MDARFHHRVAWIVAAALGGLTACAGGGGGATGGATSGHDGGVAAADCLGPTWFGALDTTSRSELVGLVCADARSGSIAAGRLDSDAGPSCKGAFTVRSDDEIEAILAALDNGEMREGNVAEANATAPAVRDFGHEISTAHGRSSEEGKGHQTRRKGRAPAPANETELSRNVTAGFKASEDALKGTSGASFDDEFLARMVVQHARELEMIDQLMPQVKSADTRCNLQKARDVALAHLQLACVVSGQVGAPPAPATSRRVPKRMGRSATGSVPGPKEAAPAPTPAPMESPKQEDQSPKASAPCAGEDPPAATPASTESPKQEEQSPNASPSCPEEAASPQAQDP